MLTLFANVFGHSGEAGSALPASLVKAAIERAVDGTDPRLRIVTGYAKTLKKPVMHAANHIFGLVDGLPPPVAVGKAPLAADPALTALLYSQERMDQLCARDPAMVEYRAEHPLATGPVTALLVAQRTEKHGFGYGELNGNVVRDVPRTTIGFDQHALMAVAGDEEETRRLMKRRAFDHLLSLALLHITERKEEREALSGRRALLRSKLDVMKRSGSLTCHTAAGERASLQTRLEEIEQQLAELGAPEDVLAGNLAIVADVLSQAQCHLWREDKTLCVDRFYVVHDQPTPSAPQLTFEELHNSQGRQVTLRMLSITAV